MSGIAASLVMAVRGWQLGPHFLGINPHLSLCGRGCVMCFWWWYEGGRCGPRLW